MKFNENLYFYYNRDFKQMIEFVDIQIRETQYKIENLRSKYFSKIIDTDIFLEEKKYLKYKLRKFEKIKKIIEIYYNNIPWGFVNEENKEKN